MKKRLIAGLGLTGKALIDYFISQTEPIIVFEEKSKENFNAIVNLNHQDLIEAYYGELPDLIWEEVSEVLISPGISQESDWVQLAKDHRVKISGELEFTYQILSQKFPSSKIIAVTGTNGKSTTVSFIKAIFDEAGLSSSLKGNIGEPFVTALLEGQKDFYILELSSFQLETIEKFKPFISVILNITEDHLDRYENIIDYSLAKANIFKNQDENDYLIYNKDDLHVNNIIKGCKAKKEAFSVYDKLEVEHNYPKENILASLLVSKLLEIPSDKIRSTLQSFTGLSHRMEKIAEYQGVKFYDDSKGTNIGAVSQGLTSFEDNVILILGGKNKGGDFSILKDLIQAKVRILYLIGEARFEIKEALDLKENMILREKISEVLEDYFPKLEKEDQVILSPGCASFDQYKNYHERGEDFKKWVHHFIEKSQS